MWRTFVIEGNSDCTNVDVAMEALLLCDEARELIEFIKEKR